MADGRLSDRVVIVTGASRGIGKAIALACAHEGAAVAVTARTEAEWDPRLPGTVYDTAAEIEADGGRAVAIPADLARPDDVDRIVEVARAGLGPIDVLVNNAAVTVPGRPPPPGSAPAAAPAPTAPAAGASPAPRLASGSFLDFPLKGFRLHFEVGLFASYRLMQLVLPDMIAARARRHREHQLLGRVHSRGRSLRARLVDRARSRTAATRPRSTTSPSPSRSRWRRSGSR